MSTLNIILLAASAVLLAIGAAGYAATRKNARAEGAEKKQKKKNRLFFVLLIFSLWLMFGTIISSFYHGKTGINIEFTLFSERVTLFGMSFAKTSVVMWIITAVVAVLALVFRLFSRISAPTVRRVSKMLWSFRLRQWKALQKAI